MILLIFENNQFLYFEFKIQFYIIYIKTYINMRIILIYVNHHKLKFKYYLK